MAWNIIRMISLAKFALSKLLDTRSVHPLRGKELPAIKRMVLHTPAGRPPFPGTQALLKGSINHPQGFFSPTVSIEPCKPSLYFLLHPDLVRVSETFARQSDLFRKLESSDRSDRYGAKHGVVISPSVKAQVFWSKSGKTQTFHRGTVHPGTRSLGWYSRHWPTLLGAKTVSLPGSNPGRHLASCY